MRLVTIPCLALAVAASGCRSGYRPHPVDLDAHARAWLERRPDERRVVAYAHDLDRLRGDAAVAFDVQDGVTLQEAEAIALVFHPDLRVARMEARVPRLGAAQAGRLPDPVVAFDIRRIVESVAHPWIVGGGIGFTIPLSGRLGAERAEALAEADAATQAARLAEAEVVHGLREAWNRWTQTGERIVLLQGYLEDLQGVLRIGRTLRDAGEIGEPQLRVLEIEQVKREGELEALGLTHRVQEASLKGLMGLLPEAELRLIPALTGDVDDPGAEADRTRLREHNLELALAKARYAASERTLALEMAKRVPDLEIGPTVETEDGDVRAGAGGGIALPLWNRNRRAIAEACAARDAAKAAFESRYELLVAELAEARGEQGVARQRGEWLTSRVGPMTDLQVAELRRISELGDMDVLIIKDALTNALEAKLEILDVQVAQALAANRIRTLLDPVPTPLR